MKHTIGRMPEEEVRRSLQELLDNKFFSVPQMARLMEMDVTTLRLFLKSESNSLIRTVNKMRIFLKEHSEWIPLTKS